MNIQDGPTHYEKYLAKIPCSGCIYIYHIILCQKCCTWNFVILLKIMNNFCVGIWHRCKRGDYFSSVGIYHNSLCQHYRFDKFSTNRYNTNFIMHSYFQSYLYWILALKPKDFRIALLWRTPTTLIWCGISLSIYLYLKYLFNYVFYFVFFACIAIACMF